MCWYLRGVGVCLGEQMLDPQSGIWCGNHLTPASLKSCSSIILRLFALVACLIGPLCTRGATSPWAASNGVRMFVIFRNTAYIHTYKSTCICTFHLIDILAESCYYYYYHHHHHIIISPALYCFISPIT